MDAAILVKLLLLGLAIGVISGMLGIGGGALVIPALVLIFHFTQQRAIGTSLAMLLPPIGIFAVWKYWKAGMVDWPAAMTLAVTFAVGALIGAWIVTRGWTSERTLRLIFVVFLLYVASNIIFRSERRVWAALSTLILGGAYAAAYFALRAIGRRWERQISLPDHYQKRLQTVLTPDYEI
jgi:uncharacterized membrane protein YfcA